MGEELGGKCCLDTHNPTPTHYYSSPAKRVAGVRNKQICDEWFCVYRENKNIWKKVVFDTRDSRWDINTHPTITSHHILTFSFILYIFISIKICIIIFIGPPLYYSLPFQFHLPHHISLSKDSK